MTNTSPDYSALAPQIRDWLIWSLEHEAWWKPGKSGYTRNVLEAGRYTQLEAIEICHEANLYSEQLEEVMLQWYV